MIKQLLSVGIIAGLGLHATLGQEAVKASFQLDPASVQSTVSDGVYGQFLEHIFNSVHGGLWGDLIRNGSLELNQAGGAWTIGDGMVASTSPITNQRLVFGSSTWRDYEISLEARKVSGDEGFMVMFRVTPDKRGYWANLGGWSNKEHGFEKNRGALGTHTPGSIAMNQWYKIRIRCQGAHYQAWLNDQPILDATDATDPILEGAIGLNAWGTQVQYRNIRVAALDGRVLFEGLPPANALAQAPAYWEFFGDGIFANETTEPVNDRACVRVRRTEFSGESGIRQSAIALRANDPVSGSFYVRGIASRGLVARFFDADGQVIFQKRYENFGKKWKELTFHFTPERTVDSATFELSVESLADVSLDQVSIFPRSASVKGGFRPDLLQAIADLKPANIRYPGGCFASGYRWKDAIGPRNGRAYYGSVIWDDRDPNQMGTDEFIDLCRRVGAEPILVVNINQDVQEALDWIDYCNGNEKTRWGTRRIRNGHYKPYKVKYWEIDNETWSMGVGRYADAVKKFSRAMRAKDPSIEIIACGGYGYDDGQGSSKDWNKGLLDRAGKYFDYLSVHYYNGIMYPQDYAKDPAKYAAYIRNDIGSLIKNSANPKIRVYCSEWGMMNDDWRSGLYTGALLNEFERESDILPMACPAVWLQFISNDRPRPRWASCSILFDQARSFGAPTYVVQKLWRDHFGPKLLTLTPAQTNLNLNLVATATEDGRAIYLKAVNPEKTAAEVTVQIGGTTLIERASMLLVNPGDIEAHNTLAEPDRVKAVPGEVTAEGGVVRFTLPALSVGAVTVVPKK